MELTFKRLLSFAMALLMVLSLVPVNGLQVFAAETSDEVTQLTAADADSLKTAIAKAVTKGGNVTITLEGDITGNVEVSEKVGLYLTIEGAGKTMNGAITVKPLSDTNDNRRITIQNVNFVNSGDTGVDFITANETNHYPRLTVQDCSFTGNGKETDVAIRTKSAYDLIIKDCTGTGLHSFLQNTSGVKVTVRDVTLADSKGGLAMGTAQNVTIRGCDLTTRTYGIRLDAVLDTSVTLNGNTVNAYIPVSVRKATAAEYKLSFSGSASSYTATNTDGVWCAICATEYEEGVALNEATGNVKVTWNTDVLDQSKVYGAYEYPILAVYSDGYSKGFDSLKSAMNFGYSGGTQEKIVVNQDITEAMDSLSGNIVTENPNGVTIKNTIVDAWVHCDENFTIGEGVTYDVTGAESGLFMYAENAVINGTVLTDCYYQRYADTKLTINEPGSMTVKTETFILRYTDGDGEAGIYIVGDNDDSTIGLNASVIYFYQGCINAKDADIKVGTYWQTNATDGTGSANLILDNSNMTVTVNEHNMKATGTSTVTLTNGSSVSVAGGYEGVNVAIDATSSFTKGGTSVFAAAAGGIGYASVEDAFAAAQNGDEVVIYAAGTYALSTSGKNITVTGAVDGVVFDNIGAKNMGGASVTFNNVTFDYYPNVNYTGLQHSGNLVYNNCTINGQVFLYGASETFNKCTFNQNSADAYNVWTYGAKAVAFNECTFNSAGKSVLIYSEQADLVNDVTVADCEFIASSAVDGKAAIEMDSSLTSGINLTVTGSTATGFGTGNVSGNSLWNNKKGNTEEKNNDITVTVDEEVVLKPVTFVAKIGNTVYADLHEAMVACKSGETVLLIADVDLAGTEWEPVSFKGTFDGQNNTIRNLTINKPGVSNTGFITSLNGTFKNVTFTNPTVTGGENTGVIAGRAGGGAALAENITVNGTIKVETTHSGYARAAVIVGGWAYGNYKNITVDGGDKTVSYVKHTGGGDGRYVAGIVGHADDVKSYVNCTVKNITISGGWLCGAIAGPGPASGLASGCAVENVNMNADYSGGMFGWYYGNGTIEDSSIKDVAFTDGTTKNGAIGGYSANTSANVVNVTIENVTNGGKALLDHVAEINGTYYLDLQAAIEAVAEGETIKLLRDVTVTTPAYGQNALNHARAVNFTLDLNGKTLSADTGNSVLRFNIANSGATADVTVTVKNGKIVSGANTWCAVMASGIDGAKAILNLEDLTVESSKAGDLAIKAWANGVVNAKNVTVNATNGAGGFYAVGGEIVLEDCVVDQKGLHTAPYLSMAIAVSSGGKLTVNSGTYSSEPTAAEEGSNQGSSHGSWVGGVMNSGGTLIINGGTFSNGNFGEDSLATAARGLIFIDTGAKLEINGGTFNALNKIIDVQNNLGDASKNPSALLAGGTYSADPTVSASYSSELIKLADGYVLEETDGTYTVIDDPKTEYISTLDQLKAFRDAVNNGTTYKGVTVYLTADIDLGGTVVAVRGGETTEWTPIGNSTNKFQGTFDGQNHTVSNLVINAASSSNQGFFGFTTDGEIKNLIIENAKVTGRLNVGVVAGTPYTSKYTNIKVTGHVEVEGLAYVGGVGGKNAYADWTDITVDVDDTSYVKAVSTENGVAYRTYVGGVIGFNGEGGHTFKNITSNINVIGDVCDIGGIFGIVHYNNNVENVSCSGNVTSTGEANEVGGIAGVWHNAKGTNVEMTNVSYTGTVSDVNGKVEGVDIVGGAYNASNETPENSGSLKIDGEEAWLLPVKIGEVKYATFEAALAAVEDGETITILATTISEGTIKLPATLKNVTFKGEEGATLKDMTIQNADGGSYSLSDLTFDGITFDNSNIVLTGWRTGFENCKNLTVTNCVFKNIVRDINLAAVHINVAADKAVENFTFTNNVIDGVTGADNSGIYGQFTGNVTVTNNTINNVAFRPYVIQITTDDGKADNFTVTGNTFSGSAKGRAQGLGNNAEGTDTVNLVVSGNIFKDITNAQQICYWNFNEETTTADMSKNYYDIDILNNPNRIYYNGAAQNAADLIEKGVYPYYEDEAMTTLVEAPAIMVTYPAGNPVYAEGKIEYYDDMLKAVPYTTNCPRLEGATVTLLKDIEAAGIRMMENDMVLDLNGHTYTITAGTGSQGTNTSGFQIRPEVTTVATIKNGTIKVAEGAPVIWMFNVYATDFVVEDVTVDCANMAYSYGESCYVHVSRAGDNTQFTGTTKIENFKSEVAGDAINVGGTMTIGENVVLGGSFELDTGATLTAPEGLDVICSNEDYKVVYENGVYTTVAKDYKAEIVGGKKYETLAEAVAAAQDGETVKLIADIAVDKEDAVIIDNTYPTFFLVEGKTITIDLQGHKIGCDADGLTKMLVGVFSTDNNGHLTITGNGTVEAINGAKDENSAGVYSLIANYESGCSIVIENGTYTLDAALDCLLYSGASAENENEGLTINGGTFTLGNVGVGTNGKPWIFNVLYSNARYVCVNGGTFNSDVNHQFWANEVYVPETLALKDNGDGTWTVVEAVAYVNELATSSHATERKVGYATLAEAIASKYGNTVTLLTDLTLTETLNIEKAITLDLGGKTLTGADGAIVLNVNAAATITNGTIKGSKSGTSSGLIDIYANLTMKDVTVETSKILALRFKAGECKAVLENCNVTGSFKGYGGSVWEIKSGTYKAASTTISDQLNGTAAISGGTFHYEIAETECAPGYVVVDNGDGTWTVKYAPACFVDADNDGILDEGEAVYGSLEALFANHKEGEVRVVLTANIASNAKVDTDADAHYYFTTNVAEGVTMDFKYADNWNYVQKMSIGENITLNAPYLVGWTDLDIYGTVNTDYAYFMGADVVVHEGGALNVTTDDATVQVKGGAKLTVNGTVDTHTLNVWAGASNLTVSGANAKLNASWIDIWDGTPTVNVENGATIDTDGIKVSRGGNINVNDAKLVADTIEVGHNTTSAGTLTETGNSTISGAIKMTGTGSVVNSDGGLNVTTDIPDHKVVFENNQYKVVAKVYVAIIDENNKFESLAEAIAAVKDGETITLVADCAENVTIKQVSGKSFTIDGAGKTYTGTITIDGTKRSTGAETLTIKNVNFVLTGNAQSGIFAKKSTYVHNVTVDGCTFTGTDGVINYGIRLHHSYNITVKNTTGTKLYDLVYAQTAVTGFTAENVTVTDSGMGFMMPYGKNMTFKNVTMDVSSVGVGIYNYNASSATFENCTIKAPTPILLEQKNATNAYTLNFNGTNNFTADENWLNVIGTDAVLKVVNNDTALDMTKVSGLAAFNGNVYYNTVVNAINKAAEGDTVKLHVDQADVTVNKAITLDLNGKAVTSAQLADVAAKVAGPEGVNVTSGVEGYVVVYKNGIYSLSKGVAKIGDVLYASLADALAAAKDGETVELIWAEGDAPIAMNGAVYGKSVTITGAATVDWNKGFLFIGRGGEGNGTVTFAGANLTSASNSASYGIHVSGREKNTTNKYDGTLVINNSTIELDYLINKGTMTLDNSTLTVKNGFSIGGRPANETESGEDATATITLNNGSKVIVNNHNGMGLGYEAIGVMNIDATSAFECTQAFLITAKGTMNIAEGGTATVAGTLTNKGSIVMAKADAVTATKTLLSDVNATITAPEGVSVESGVDGYKVLYHNGVYKLVADSTVAYNDETGVAYATVQEALNAAKSGETVKMMEDSSEPTAVLTVFDGITLDLNGKTLEALYVIAPFDGSKIIDSTDDANDAANFRTNGTGLLKVAKANMALKSNKQLPVWSEADGGFRFVTVTGGGKLEMSGNTAQFNFQVSRENSNNALIEAMKDGGVASGLTVRVKMTWKTADGSVQTQYATFDKQYVEVFANSYTEDQYGKYFSKDFQLIAHGVENFTEFTCTAEIVYDTVVCEAVTK